MRSRGLLSVGLEHGKQAMQNLVKVVERQAEGIPLSGVATLKFPAECYEHTAF